MTGCRIGKVTPKLSVVAPVKRGADFVFNMQSAVEEINEILNGDIAGYSIVAWDFKGVFASGRRIHEDSFVGLTLMPEFVKAIIQRSSTIDVARDVFMGEL